VLEHLWADAECRVVTVTREEEGVGLLSGAWLGGKRGAILIARGAGIDKAMDVRTEEELRRAYDRILGEDGPLVVCVKVVKGRAEGSFDRGGLVPHGA
jgi:thiamine pyrophosphate-dependent acetolactate synthase large subunit-like protein